jgi:hypothetical protein
MTVTTEAPTAEQPRKHRTLVIRVVAVIIGVVLLVALVLAWQWWRHPDLLPDDGGEWGTAPRPVADAALAFAITSPTAKGAPTTLTWHGGRAVFSTNSAHAQSEFSLCEVRPEVVRSGIFFGWPVSGLSRFCSAIHPVAPGMRLTYPNRHEFLMMTLTPTRPGSVRVTGVDIDYALGADHLFRRGTDHVELVAHFTAR